MTPENNGMNQNGDIHKQPGRIRRNMPSMSHPQAERLYASLCAYADQETAERISRRRLIGKTPAKKQKRDWAQAICRDLNEQFDAETVKKIRIQCACGPAQAKMEALRKLYRTSGALEAVAERLSTEGAPSCVKDGILYISYPICYCSFVNKFFERLPDTWCYCGVGYTRRNLEYALGCPVDVELLESVKQGNKRCLMQVTRMGETEDLVSMDKLLYDKGDSIGRGL